jgi:hypothetical protein
MFHARGQIEIHRGLFFAGRPEEGEHLEVMCINGDIILK